MTQILSTHLTSMKTENYMITKLGVAWASSNYVAFDDRLLNPMLEGQVFAAAYQKDPQIIEQRYKYDSELFERFGAGEEISTLNIFDGTIASEVYNHIDLFVDPRISVLL